MKIKNEQVDDAQSESSRRNLELESYRENISHLVQRIHQLCSEKGVLTQMLASSEQRLD